MENHESDTSPAPAPKNRDDSVTSPEPHATPEEMPPINRDDGNTHQAHTVTFTAPIADGYEGDPLPPSCARRKGLLLTLGLIVALLGLGGGLGAAIYQQTQWEQRLYATLRHTRAAATVQAVRDRVTATVEADHLAHTRAEYARLGAAYSHIRSRATVTSRRAQATVQALQYLVAQAPPTATPTPDSPYLQTCLQEDIDQQQASCTRDVDSFFVNGSSDDAIAFVVPNPNGYNLSTIQWRVFKSTSGGGSTSEGSYTDSSGDPQNPGVWWSLPGLFSHFADFQYGLETGNYKVEVLDHDGQVMAATTFTVQESPFAQSNGETPTPDISNSFYDYPTDTPGPTL